MEHILLVDDEKNYLIVLETLLEEAGYRVTTASSALQALELMADFEPDLMITDMRMPHMTGLTLVEKTHALYSDMPLIIMTAHGTVETAVEAMKQGASDYILKPFENQALLLTVERSLKIRNLLTQNRLLKENMRAGKGMGSLIGDSPAMSEVYELVDKVADTKATVLITGESGTGKELVARAIHQASARAEAAFIAVHCMALSESLLESELFGHEKGAFTGAGSRRKGRFELAHGGTIFLDEVGEISLNLQVKLLRVLQERSFERVGGTDNIKIDVRIIAATNLNLSQAVREGAFREDLYYRLNVMQIKLPPLRERREDLPMLVNHFVRKYGQEIGRGIPRISEAAMRQIYDHSWPGNVRELENALERAVIMAGDIILPQHLPLETRPAASVGPEAPEKITDLNLALETLERRLINQALEKNCGVAAHAARDLGITKTNLAYKMKKYGIRD
ncbi:MAG: sigma-54 dependent transcriptional regulator [Desulfarculales bacterium]|jgi:two-component system NtrC family response regulator|nr:sigma-54 dependent transcriptional regulator [Desulfarculales bacterium]